MDCERRAALLQELGALGPVPAERESGAEEYCDGGLARHRDVQFDPQRSRPWKLGWLDADKDYDA